MKILVIGGIGPAGSAIVKSLRTFGHKVVTVVPGFGINVITGDGLVEAMQDTEVVVDLSDSPLAGGQAAIDFFSTAWRNLLMAAINARVKHYVTLSIAGIDQMLGVDYIYSKKIQEYFIRMAGIPFTIVRSAQFPDFISGIRSAASANINGVISKRTFHPIAANDVAGIVAGFAVGEPLNGIMEITGPERKQICDFVQDDPHMTVRDQSNNSGENSQDFHVAVQKMALVPQQNAGSEQIRLEQWLAEQVAEV